MVLLIRGEPIWEWILQGDRAAGQTAVMYSALNLFAGGTHYGK